MKTNTRFLTVLISVAGLLLTAGAMAQPTPTPSITEDFSIGGGNAGPNLRYIIDVDLAAAVTGLSTPAFWNSLPGGLSGGWTPDPIANNPSADNTVMAVGNQDISANWGLCYIDIADNHVGGTTNFINLQDYKMKAYLYVQGTADFPSGRMQGGIYARAGSGQPDLFRFGPWHNSGSTGGGPGFGHRGSAAGTVTVGAATPIANARWCLFEVSVEDVTGAVGFDSSGDGSIDINDPAEYLPDLALDLADYATGYPAFWTVGDYEQDVTPMLVDDVELFGPAPFGTPTPTPTPTNTPLVAGLGEWRDYR